ncbi:MAG: hypothetical protein WCI11_17225 [Candidatus Methylumidiphilus sp.]
MKSFQFAESIPSALKILDERFGNKRHFNTTLVRDAFGILSVVLPDNVIADEFIWNDVALQLHEALGSYSPGDDQVLLRESDLISPTDVIESPDRVRLPDAPNTWLVDRLQTNQDWLRTPLVRKPPLPTAVAFSIKGGVGRTTAFALWAWHLARLGKNVILVDLDLEAPGVAGVLLDEDYLPDYGLVDWLVEALLGPPDESLLRECLTECALSSDEPGRIRVLPAFGKISCDYVNKLGRVYMPTFAPETGKFSGLAERLLMLLEQLTRLSDKPDAVLLDARAGLHDIGSAAVTQLGAEVFMFARDDYQSWQAYELLFAHLSSAQSVEWGMPEQDLRWRIKMVSAQAEPTQSAKLRFIDRSYAKWQRFYDSEPVDDQKILINLGLSGSREEDDISNNTPKIFDRNEDYAPHYPFFISFDPRIRSLNLIDSSERPDWSIIETAFGDFFVGATTRLFPDERIYEVLLK